MHGDELLEVLVGAVAVVQDALTTIVDWRPAGDIAGWFTLGWFAYNPTYAARPDNSGLALFRYGAHWELGVLDSHLAFGADVTMFTDRCGGTTAAAASAAARKNQTPPCSWGS